jgi:geranylgeranyl diphosphate synthase type II
VQEQLYQIGLYLGLSFQLQDDYLDTFGTTEKVGKRIGNDILAHKKTYMMLRLHEAMAQSNPHAVHDLYNQDLSEDDLIRTVQSWYIEQGIDQEAKQLIQSYYDKAIQLFDEIQVPSERKSTLRELMYQLHHRES